MSRLPALLLFVSSVLACSSKDAPTSAPVDAEGETDEGELPKCEAAVSKGPWVVAVDASSAKIRWESCKSGGGAISYGTDKSTTRVDSKVSQAVVTTNNEVPLRKSGDWAGTYFMHEVALTGLLPATCYTYGLETDATAQGRFCTARPAGSEFTFATLGDTNPGFGDISKMLPKVYEQKPDFTIHVGDIQYYSSGLETYGQWMELMRPMLRGAAFFPAIGNHEYEKPLEREEYVERFWGKPGFDGNSDYYRFEWAGVWFFALNTEIAMDEASPQGTWLKSMLEDASKKPGFRFSVVFLHRPYVTCGDTGQNDTLRKAFLPSFQKNGVKLVVAGHMHGYERFEMDDITWVTSAGGGALLGKIDENASRAECAYRKSSGAFWNATLFSVKAGQVSATTYDDKGAIRDTFFLVVP